jgi:hypothetical protein
MANGNNLLDMTIDAKELREFVKTLELFEPGLRRQFVKDIKADIKPLAQTIASNINSENVGAVGNMRGWNNNGRTGWSKVRASVYATPGGGKSGSVARIEVYGSGDKKAALKIADLAGTKNGTSATVSKSYVGPYGLVRTHANTSQGETMKKELDRWPLWKGKGGRFVWTNFIGQRRKMVEIAVSIINRYADRVNSGGKP